MNSEKISLTKQIGCLQSESETEKKKITIALGGGCTKNHPDGMTGDV